MNLIPIQSAAPTAVANQSQPSINQQVNSTQSTANPAQNASQTSTEATDQMAGESIHTELVDNVEANQDFRQIFHAIAVEAAAVLQPEAIQPVMDLPAGAVETVVAQLSQAKEAAQTIVKNDFANLQALLAAPGSEVAAPGSELAAQVTTGMSTEALKGNVVGRQSHPAQLMEGFGPQFIGSNVEPAPLINEGNLTTSQVQQAPQTNQTSHQTVPTVTGQEFSMAELQAMGMKPVAQHQTVQMTGKPAVQAQLTEAQAVIQDLVQISNTFQAAKPNFNLVNSTGVAEAQTAIANGQMKLLDQVAVKGAAAEAANSGLQNLPEVNSLSSVPAGGNEGQKSGNFANLLNDPSSGILEAKTKTNQETGKPTEFSKELSNADIQKAYEVSSPTTTTNSTIQSTTNTQMVNSKASPMATAAVEQVSEAVQTAKSQGVKVMEVDLHPESLGRIRLKISQVPGSNQLAGGQTLRVQILTMKAEAHGLLERHMAELRDALPGFEVRVTTAASSAEGTNSGNLDFGQTARRFTDSFQESSQGRGQNQQEGNEAQDGSNDQEGNDPEFKRIVEEFRSLVQA